MKYKVIGQYKDSPYTTTKIHDLEIFFKSSDKTLNIYKHMGLNNYSEVHNIEGIYTCEVRPCVATNNSKK